MPRCQRTFRRLPDAPKLGAGEHAEWLCPWCPDNREVYALLQDASLLAYAEFAFQQGIQDFGTPPDPRRPLSLFLGLFPECVYEPVERRYDIYLQAGSDDLQLRLQIGHEVFHRLCSLGRIFHWTHEMMACLFSVRLLEASGKAAYAELMRSQYSLDAVRMSADEMRQIDLRLPPTHDTAALYGRAFVLGEALVEAAGWPALCRLSRSTVDNAPDISGWLRTLDRNTAATCAHWVGTLA